MPEQQSQTLLPGAQQIVRDAYAKQTSAHTEKLCVHHWMAALLGHNHDMVVDLLGEDQFKSLVTYIQQAQSEEDKAQPLDEPSMLLMAEEVAQKRGKSVIAERDLAIALLQYAEFKLQPLSRTAEAGSLAARSPAAHAPTLDRFGRNLILDAQQNMLMDVIGRDLEIELIFETLCRDKKRNPLLIGEAGVGKTAIAEGLAYRIVSGKAPKAMQNMRLIALQPTALIAGVQSSPELAGVIQNILKEASQPDVILFIDEVHTLIGSGGIPGLNDLASMLKPALARGDLACIAATTPEEYSRYIERDRALERRFAPIRIHPLTAADTLQVLQTLRTRWVEEKHVQVNDEVLAFLVNFADHYMHNRNFPDKGVDLLDQCFAYARSHDKEEVQLEDAHRVAERMVSMPASQDQGLNQLDKELRRLRLLPEDKVVELIERLQITLRGLEMHPERPNAVVMLAMSSENLSNLDKLAELFSTSLYGAPDRVTEIKLFGLKHESDTNRLIGAPPGFIGYDDSLPLHKLAQRPWSVLVFKGVEDCHPQIRKYLANALSDGYVTDAHGKSIYLSDAVVLLGVDYERTAARHVGLGFSTIRPDSPAQNNLEDVVYESLEELLSAELMAQVDVLVIQPPAAEESTSTTGTEITQLDNLTAQYALQNIVLHWDDSILAWIQKQQVNERGWWRKFEQEVGKAVLALASGKGAFIKPVRLRVLHSGDQFIIQKEADR